MLVIDPAGIGIKMQMILLEIFIGFSSTNREYTRKIDCKRGGLKTVAFCHLDLYAICWQRCVWEFVVEIFAGSASKAITRWEMLLPAWKRIT